MDSKTENYGIKRTKGEPSLDASKHLAAAVPRLLNSAEIAERQAEMRTRMALALSAQPGRPRSETN